MYFIFEIPPTGVNVWVGNPSAAVRMRERIASAKSSGFASLRKSQLYILFINFPRSSYDIILFLSWRERQDAPQLLFHSYKVHNPILLIFVLLPQSFSPVPRLWRYQSPDG